MLANFLIVGTQKGGTTALASFLATHPQISFSREKELHFFDQNRRYFNKAGEPNYDLYSSMLDARDGALAIGEATPIYMYLPEVAERLHAYNPKLKLISILRDPRHRAYSHYRMEVERGNESLSFADAIAREQERIRGDVLSNPAATRRLFSYIDRGFYAHQIKHLLKYFKKEQLLVLRNEDLSGDHDNTLRQVYDFLLLDRIAPPEPRRVFQQTYSAMPDDIKVQLTKVYANDTEELESMFGWKLDSWRE